MSAAEVVIVASGANLASLSFALERLERRAIVSADPERIRTATHVIMPGVGAAASAMAELRRTGLDRLIPQLTQPLLGICLGMQLLYEGSDEGNVSCLGVLRGHAARLEQTSDRPVPHMGWNTLEPLRSSPLLEGVERGARAYFVHSYALPVSAATVATSEYGVAFSACVEWRNFFGVQFHPERSGAVGARILRNFIDLPLCAASREEVRACG